MGLFKKKTCSCNGACNNKSDQYQKGDIAILGTGCAKCIELEQNVQAALKELNINKEVKHITDIVEIAQFGVMTTPALVVEGKVVASGKVLSIEEVKDVLSKK